MWVAWPARQAGGRRRPPFSYSLDALGTSEFGTPQLFATQELPMSR